MRDQDLLIDAQGVSYHYGQGNLLQPVLKDVSFSLKTGEFVILAGPSGSGKSTLLSLIGALRKGQGTGRLNVSGQDLYRMTEPQMQKIRQNIGYIFQQHNLLNFLTAAQNVEMTLEMFPQHTDAERHAMAMDILAKVNLADSADKFPAQLSVGQKQRVAIARGLVHHPRMVLADEPTASLDGKTATQVVDMLHHMTRNRQCGALVVTHDTRLFDYADRILHIEDGRLAS